MGPSLIDVHAHHYPDAYLAACQRPDSGLSTYLRDDARLVVRQDGAVALAAPQPMPTVAERLRAMDDAGIRTQLVSISAPNVYRFPLGWRAALTRDLNDELLDMSAVSDGRLRCLLSLPLPDLDQAARELARGLSHPAAAGVMLTTTIAGRPLDDPSLRPILADLDASRCVVLVHPTTACATEGTREYALSLALDFLAETTNCIARLVYSGTFGRFPNIRWVFSHLGGTTPFLIHRFDNYFHQFPECREHITSPPSEILRGVWFDTVSTHPPAWRCALDTFASGQFVFGTDYPHVPGGLSRFVDTFAAVDLDPATRADIGHGNAAKLLDLP
ncbi:amidohydrolase family protein [Actinomadura macra]|uniref:amidohydrolase family protein n=1 Tax=Actinomadura macra TaxID=46164 RepID=UPI0009FF4715|nr:amidohydrolase family protein [Actinomadura macra]